MNHDPISARSARSARSAPHPHGRTLGAAAFALFALAGCSKPQPDGYKEGELGNGGFVFSCDDASACPEGSTAAKTFPSAVSLGATFRVRYIPKSDTSGVRITFDDTRPERGLTLGPVSDFVSRGPGGLLGLREGFATLATKDAGGSLVDYVVVRVARPDALVIFDDDVSGASPPPVTAVKLRLGDRGRYRALAQQKKETLAGMLNVEWRSENTAVLDIESVSPGKALVVARALGTTTLFAEGGTFEQPIAVEVVP